MYLPGQRRVGFPELQGTFGQNTEMGIPAMMGKWLLISSFQGATPKIVYAVKWFQGKGGRRCEEIRLFHCYELIIAKPVT